MCAGFEGASEGLGDEHGGPDPDAGHGGQDLVKRVGLHQGLDLRGDVTPMGVQGDELARQVREHHASGVGADQHLGLGVQGVDDRVRPGGVACAPEPGWMMHTDQGFQYQHPSWRNLIDDNGGVQSMSRKANCYDNAVMENFFGHLSCIVGVRHVARLSRMVFAFGGIVGWAVMSCPAMRMVT